MRRLPVYLLLDTSGSMRGAPIEAVRNGVETLLAAIRRDPYALETAYLSVVTFGLEVKQDVPLTEVSLFQLPELIPRGGSSLDEALKFVAECIDREVRKTTENEKGDWPPMILIMTDGCVSYDRQDRLIEFKKRKWRNVIAILVEEESVDAIKKVTENCFVGLDYLNSFKSLSDLVCACVPSYLLFTAIDSEWERYYGWYSDEECNASDSMSKLPPPPPDIVLV